MDPRADKEDEEKNRSTADSNQTQNMSQGTSGATDESDDWCTYLYQT
mgnify:CR=1 FL=1